MVCVEAQKAVALSATRKACTREGNSENRQATCSDDRGTGRLNSSASTSRQCGLVVWALTEGSIKACVALIFTRTGPGFSSMLPLPQKLCMLGVNARSLKNWLRCYSGVIRLKLGLPSWVGALLSPRGNGHQASWPFFCCLRSFIMILTSLTNLVDILLSWYRCEKMPSASDLGLLEVADAGRSPCVHPCLEERTGRQHVHTGANFRCCFGQIQSYQR